VRNLEHKAEHEALILVLPDAGETTMRANWDWTAVDWGQIFWSSLPLLVVPLGAAVLGFAIGRLIRGRPYIGRHIREPRG
jgi:hypothetical protein